ncbi:MAG: hypothetical protein COA47_11620 [Robiginitomaculum sp.]|nr:MAG: hypothetical protein COA47_11620 [Robiginitomaculum sp.]
MRVWIFAIFLGLASPTFAAEEIAEIAPTERGPAIGAIIPSNLSSLDHTGQPANFDSLVGPNGMVLVFIRSTKWCRFCKMQLADLATGVDEIEARGYSLIVLSYDSVKDNTRYVEEYKPGFTILSDRKSEVIDAFGIRNHKYGKMHFAHGVPHPMIFVIDADKTIQAKLAESGYKDRPAIAVVIETLDALPPKDAP